MLSKIRTWIESESDAIGLLLLLIASPLSPLATLEELKERGLYTYLPSVDDILEKNFQEGLSEKMREVLYVALDSDREGTKKPLMRLYDKIISNIRVQLELMDYNLSQLYQFISIFITLVPSILFSTVLFINPSYSVSLLLGISIFSFFSSFLGLTIYPCELRLSSPNIKYLLMYLFVIPTYHVISAKLICNPLLASITILSFPIMLMTCRKLREKLNLLKYSHELVEKASLCLWNIFECIGIDDPEKLLRKRWYGISKAVATTLYLIGIFGTDDVSDTISGLEKMLREYIKSFNRLRSKTKVMLFYSIIEAAVSASIYAFLLYTLRYFCSLSVTGIPINIPSRSFLKYLESIIDITFVLNSISLSIVTATVREGNPLYFIVYLPVIGLSLWFAYDFSLTFIRMLLVI